MVIGRTIGGWRRGSQERARANARAAATALSRHRLEREEVELYLRARGVTGTAGVVRRPA